jgi:hypothetical protein
LRFKCHKYRGYLVRECKGYVPEGYSRCRVYNQGRTQYLLAEMPTVEAAEAWIDAKELENFRESIGT